MAKVKVGRAAVMGAIVYAGNPYMYECCQVCGKPVRRQIGRTDGKVRRHKRNGSWCPGGAGLPRPLTLALKRQKTPHGSMTAIAYGPSPRSIEWKSSHSRTMAPGPREMHAISRKLRREAEAESWIASMKARKGKQ